jgi:glycine/D-amino acid oxidase-like deaminating enzyme
MPQPNASIEETYNGRGRMRYDRFVASARQTPYWWEKTPRPNFSYTSVPQRADVTIVGSGYTGLAAAITLARRGRQVLVLEAEGIGSGASTRNTGMLGPSFPKKTLSQLGARHGPQKADAIMRECILARDYCIDLITREGIECGLAQVGRFRGALNPRTYEQLGRHIDTLRTKFGLNAHLVPRSEQHAEVGSDIYHGGLVLEDDYCLDPARYHQGLLDRAIAAGASIVPDTPVTAILRDGPIFNVTTPHQLVSTRHVIIATNAYTGAATPYFRRRVIPIQSSVIVTAPLQSQTIDRLLPKRRMVEEARRVFYYYRPTPDGKRIMFGGRTVRSDDGGAESSASLYAGLVGIFPEIEGVSVEYAWSGKVAYTFDYLPHLGAIDGMHYALGCCGSGIAKATWLGTKVALAVLGEITCHSAFEDIAFLTRPLYFGTPWFLKPIVAWHRLVDHLGL